MILLKIVSSLKNSVWTVSALIVHVLLLGSIYVIYLRSPVIRGLRPQQPFNASGLTAPANRLVLIVTDGLRAESFFKNGCKDVPNLSKLMIRHGLVGISNTRAPTESRPCYIAMIAGFYEDPSAVTRGWKVNPVAFDTVFNRSCHTYAWAPWDVIKIFSRVVDKRSKCRFVFNGYHGNPNTVSEWYYELDYWVFEQVKQVLEQKAEELRDELQVVFFLNLLGIDLAGHDSKPGRPLFRYNLHRTEETIANIYDFFEEIFPDKRTAYVMTSDHGQTNAGNHGGGGAYETETPFFFWGAGVAKEAPHDGRTFKVGPYVTLPLHELEQVQLAPLMSALIGLPPPMNNLGILPVGYLDVTAEYEAHAMHSNALQLLEQYQTLLRAHEIGMFTPYLSSFKRLELSHIEDYVRVARTHFKAQGYAAAINASLDIMYSALEGIDYYHNYYRNSLLISTTLSFLGWMYYLLLLCVEEQGIKCATRKFSRPLCVAVVAAVIFIILQRVPAALSFYLVLPNVIWLLVTRKQCTLSWKRHGSLLVQLALVTFGAELLVFGFFKRKLILVTYFLFALLNNLQAYVTPSLKAMVWPVLVMVLLMFPLLPPIVVHRNEWLLFLGLIYTILRPFIVKSRLKHQQKVVTYACLANAMLTIYQLSNQLGVSLVSYAISWCFLIYSFGAILFNSSGELKERVELIFFHLTSAYLLFCTSSEPLFIVTLVWELIISLTRQENPPSIAGSYLQSPLHLAFTTILYICFSSVGAGYVDWSDFFNPDIVRCFNSKSTSSLTTNLTMMKLFIPMLLIVSIIFGTSHSARTHERQIFICLLLICNVMGLNFLFLVRNQGSWLEIGTSISIFVMMEATPFVLLFVFFLAKLMLRLLALPRIDWHWRPIGRSSDDSRIAKKPNV